MNFNKIEYTPLWTRIQYYNMKTMFLLILKFFIDLVIDLLQLVIEVTPENQKTSIFCSK